MKTQMKAIIASAVVIVLALSAVAGVTYSWFSDTKEADVAITTGAIKIDDVTPQISYSESPWNNWTNIENLRWDTDSVSGKKILLTSVPPIGDNAKIRIHIPSVSIKNTIQANYYEQISVKNSDDIKSDLFTSSGAIETAIALGPVSDNNINTIHEHTIELHFNSNNGAQGQKFTISLELVALQSNASTPNGVSASTSTSESTNVTVSAGSEGSASIVIPKQTTPSSVIVKEADSETAKSYGVVASTDVLCGIDVKGYDADKKQINNYLKDEAVTLKMVIDGNYSTRGLTIYHGTEIFSPGNGESIDIDYDASIDKTIVTIVTKQGFSPYFATFNSVASIGAIEYNTVKDAINNANNGDTVVLLKDISEPIVVSKNDITLDLNSKNIIMSKPDNVAIKVTSGGKLTITGEGFVNGGSGGDNVGVWANGGEVLIKNGTFTVGADKKGSGNTVIYSYNGNIVIEGGYFYTDSVYNGKHYVLNQNNIHESPGKITVKGGIFVDFDPSGGDDFYKESFLAEGYTVSSSKAAVNYKEVTYYFVTDISENRGIILPDGITAESFGDNTVYDGTNYYKTMTDALKAIHGKNIHTLWCKPNSDVGSMTHGHVCSDLTIYGNHAYVSSGEQEFELDTYVYDDTFSQVENPTEYLKSDVTLKVYSLDKSGAWGERHSDKKITLIFEDCKEMNRIYLSGVTGTIDVTVKDCSFGSNKETAFYTNAPGNIKIINTLFHDHALAINQNNKSSGTQNIEIINCVFVNNGLHSNGPEWDSFKAPVRIVASGQGSSSNLTTSNCTFVYSDENEPVYGNYRFGDTRQGEKVLGTVTWNGTSVEQDKPQLS